MPTPSATPDIHVDHSVASRTSPGRRVTDAPSRMFHWLFALSFLGAYLTADGERWRLLHVTLGYTMIGLLTARVLYGLVGPRQAGLGLMWRKLANLPAWLRSLLSLRSVASLGDVNWRQGQNLLMALAVVSLLVMTVPLTLSGYATYNEWGDALGGDWIEEVHEFFGNAFLAIVLAHVGLIMALSVWRRKNQALPMLTGRTEGAGPDLVKKNHLWLAALVLIAVLAFWAWEWQQSPNGLIPGKGQAHVSAQDDEDDD
ncbi:MAG TPA: cytochrome b/b6 domain-containing protein [Aquabacterium sp.]|nr:cytochrome b/b6 domain-containing protein [Aquabacterium sp.]HRH29523.1 cytochrome b/b6 domain-containing protein [Aquabacterium sp.]